MEQAGGGQVGQRGGWPPTLHSAGAPADTQPGWCSGGRRAGPSPSLGACGSSIPLLTLSLLGVLFSPTFSSSVTAGLHHTSRDGDGEGGRKENNIIPVSFLHYLSPFGNLKTRAVGEGCHRGESDWSRGWMLTTEEWPCSDQEGSEGTAGPGPRCLLMLGLQGLSEGSKPFPELFAK